MLDVLEHMNVDGKLAKQLKNENINAVPALYELLKMLLKIVSQREGVVSRLIAGDTALQKLAAYKDKDNPALCSWRYEIFGSEALKLRNGELSIRYNRNRKTLNLPTSIVRRPPDALVDRPGMPFSGIGAIASVRLPARASARRKKANRLAAASHRSPEGLRFKSPSRPPEADIKLIVFRLFRIDTKLMPRRIMAQQLSRRTRPIRLAVRNQHFFI